MSDTTAYPNVLVIGVGALERGDDAAGRFAARHIKSTSSDAMFSVKELRGEATELMDAWGRADAVVLIDAACTGAAPGTVQRFDASHEPLPAELAQTSTHDIGVSDAIELARAMDMLPMRVIVYAIEVKHLDHGRTLSPSVEQAIPEVATSIIQEAKKIIEGSPRHA